MGQTVPNSASESPDPLVDWDDLKESEEDEDENWEDEEWDDEEEEAV